MQVTLTKDRAGWAAAYLTIWQGFRGLTERELEFTALIALRYLNLQASVTNAELLAELLLSPSAKLALRKQMSAE